MTYQTSHFCETHLVCVIPPYVRPNITEPVTVKLYVASSGKTSEPQEFVYTPVAGVVNSVSMETRTPVQFLNKLVWQTANNKQDEDTDMMPPPETNMVPLLQRRLSTNMSQSSSEPHSPPLHMLKQEIIDENSQNSLLETNRFRYVSESSLDVHNNDSNISVMTENSVDIRRSSISSEIDQNTMPESTSFTNINENTQLHSDCSNLTMEAPPMQLQQQPPIMPQIKMFHNEIIQGNQTQTPTNSFQGVDLTLRPFLGSVADLANTTAPSLATLETFGITEGTIPLPAQSSQSVESYLNKIETKTAIAEAKLDNSTLVSQQIFPVTTASANILSVTNTDVKNEMMNGMLIANEKRDMINTIIVAEKANMINNIIATNNEKAEIMNNILAANDQKAEIINNMILDNEKQKIINNILVENEKVEVMNSMLSTNEKQEIINNIIAEKEKTEMMNNIILNEKSQMINNIIENKKAEMINKILTNDKPELMNNLMISKIDKNELINNMITDKQNLSYVMQKSIIEPPTTLNSEIAALPVEANQNLGHLIPTTQLNNALVTNQIVTEKLDALVNCAAESHICNPTASFTAEPPKNIIETSHVNTQDILLNHHNQLLVPPIIQTNMMPNTEVPPSHSTNTLSTAVILNTQMSPSLMCAPENFLNASNPLNICTNPSPLPSPLHTHISPNPIQPTLPTNVTNAETEKTMYLNATMIPTHEQLLAKEGSICSTIAMNRNDTFLPTTQNMILSHTNLTNCEAKCEKKNEEIPSVFTTMTDNELMNIINPNCFDQGNAFN